MTTLMPHSTIHPPSQLSACPACGHGLPVDMTASADGAVEAQRRIYELETQVRHLNSIAATSADKLADYEDELRFLREAHARAQQQGTLANSYQEGPGPAAQPVQPPPPQQQQPSLSRLASLSSLLPGRRKEINANNALATPPAQMYPQNNTTLSPPKTPFYMNTPNYSAPHLQSSHSDSQVLTLNSLQSSLDEERTLRLRAESSLTQTQTELEELTAQLFGQANEMVATERKARAKLEERVKILEQRDTDKRKRLDRLEKAVARIERVRGMVGP